MKELSLEAVHYQDNWKYEGESVNRLQIKAKQLKWM
jgi:uncharacterized radical SAM superfamily Fe-S cluster-containing enzyme